MLSRLLPRSSNFFEFFEKNASLAVASAHELGKLSNDPVGIVEVSRRIKDLEHQADQTTHMCIEMLHKTFVTPIDRNDIHRLAAKLDDIVDRVDGVARQLELFEIKSLPEPALEAAKVIVLATEAVERAVKGLRNMKNASAILAECVTINKLENEADLIKASSVARLFHEEHDAINVIKWNEIFQLYESVTDACKQVSETIEGIVLENA